MTFDQGDLVTMIGHVELTADPHNIRVWAQSPYHSASGLRRPRSEVAVTLQRAGDVPDGELVAVHGTWRATGIHRATITPIQQAKLTTLSANPTAQTTGEAGEEVFVNTMRAIRATGVPVISTGGTTDTGWAHVLYTNAELEMLHANCPMRLDVFIAITPVTPH